MRHQSQIVLNRQDIRKMAIKYIESLNYVTNGEVKIINNPKAGNYDEQFQITVGIEVKIRNSRDEFWDKFAEDDTKLASNLDALEKYHKEAVELGA